MLGCLVEKQRTTPDAYPLTLNALRLACNQSTNRDPVVDYDEKDDPRGAAAARAGGAGRAWRAATRSRATKYRHLLDEALGLDGAELALLAVLMLRGPADAGRAEAAHRAPARASPTSRRSRTASTRSRGAASCAQLDRRPGQKEERYTHLLAAEDEGEGEGETPAAAPLPVAMESPPAAAPALREPDPLERRVDALEAELAGLRTELAELREQLGG